QAVVSPAWGGSTAPATVARRWHRPSHQTGAVAPPAWGGGTAPVRQSTD
ncbi:unnamed protein product, partial [Musa textilis]